MLLATGNAGSNLYFLTAFFGGVISFLSPCVLPIVPGYLSFITGLTVGELQEGGRSRLTHIALNTGLFVLGFTGVFVLLGLITTELGQTLFENQRTLTRISGGIMIFMALYLAGSQLLMAPRLYGEYRFHPHFERFGPVAAPFAGAAFGLGWTPCIGPILGTVLTFAAEGRDVTRAAILLIAYSLGLGSAFLVVGLGFGRFAAPLAWVKRHARAITFVSAAMLGIFGVVLVADELPWVTARLSDGMDAIGMGWLISIG